MLCGYSLAAGDEQPGSIHGWQWWFFMYLCWVAWHRCHKDLGFAFDLKINAGLEIRYNNGYLE